MEVNCPNCHIGFNEWEENLGRTIECPYCYSTFVAQKQENSKKKKSSRSAQVIDETVPKDVVNKQKDGIKKPPLKKMPSESPHITNTPLTKTDGYSPAIHKILHDPPTCPQ